MPPISETRLYRPVVPRPDALAIGWLYPYTRAVSMSSLGYLILFRQLEERDDVAVTRISTDTMQHTPITGMALLGVSFSFELDSLKILEMLSHYEIPLFSRDRDHRHPLIFAGGPVIISNPEPYADFFDFFLIGEGETLLDEVVTTYQALQSIENRLERLAELAMRVPGVYVPALYTVSYQADGTIRQLEPTRPGLPLPVEKRIETDMDATLASTPILTSDTVFANTFLVEVMRGCAHRCRFCLASYTMLPARGASLEAIVERIALGLQYTSKIGLLGALIADHPRFDELCTYLQSQDGIQVTAASLRADTLTPHIAETFRRGGQQTLTLAIETGSERLRNRINKHLKTDAILQAAAITASVGIPALKLYIMVGLPDETWADLEETVALVRRIKQENPRLRLVVGCSTFVPKAATPFQWMPREETRLLQDKQAYLRKSLYRFCDFRPSSAKWDTVQALLSRGDRRLSDWLVAFTQQGGNLGAVQRAQKQLCQAGLSLPDGTWYANRPRPLEEILPWEPLSLGLSKATLYAESGLKPTTGTVPVLQPPRIAVS